MSDSNSNYLSKAFSDNLSKFTDRFGKDAVIFSDTNKLVALIEKTLYKDKDCFQVLIGDVSISINPDASICCNVAKPSIWIDNNYLELVFGEDGKEIIYSPSEIGDLRRDRKRLETIREAFDILKGEE